MGLLWPTRLQLRRTGNKSARSQRQPGVRTGICFTPSPTPQRPKHPVTAAPSYQRLGGIIEPLQQNVKRRRDSRLMSHSSADRTET